MWTVDQIPPQRLVAPLVVIDVHGKAANDPDYQVSLDDLANWEHDNGPVPPGAVVMARTGWAARWDSMKDYRNADDKGAMHFPAPLWGAISLQDRPSTASTCQVRASSSAMV